MARKAKQTPTGRQALGRGLGDLMRRTAEEVPVKKQSSKTASPGTQKDRHRAEVVSSKSAKAEQGEDVQLRLLELRSIAPNAAQPRQQFDAEEINTLAQSIQASGVLQPIIVRPQAKGRADYEIVAGERRYRAAEKAGLEEIPAIVRNLSDRETLELGIVENVQRSDLNPIEEAAAYERLIEDFELSQSEVAKTVGKERASIANSLRLLRLPLEVQKLLSERKLTAGHGRALLMLESAEKQRLLAEMILRDQLSVRAAEEQARGGLTGAKAAKPKTPRRIKQLEKSPSVLEIEEKLRRSLGTKVSLELHKNHSGELTISFFSRAELESLLERLGV